MKNNNSLTRGLNLELCVLVRARAQLLNMFYINTHRSGQGWPSGENTCLLPMWPGLDFRSRRHTWIEFVGSLLCFERFSLVYSGFPLSPKTNI